jgi:hypothetical protein
MNSLTSTENTNKTNYKLKNAPLKSENIKKIIEKNILSEKKHTSKEYTFANSKEPTYYELKSMFG